MAEQIEKTGPAAGTGQIRKTEEKYGTGRTEKKETNAGTGQPIKAGGSARAERLDKYVAEAAGLTRKEAKNAIAKGRVIKNGAVCREPEEKVGSEDTVCLDGVPITTAGMVYLMLHKPAGVISATEDGREKTVLDLLKGTQDGAELLKKTELFPVGRLDKDTEGLLFLTNDGALTHRLLSPKKHVDKIYYVRVSGRVPEDAAERFAAGIPVGTEYTALPAGLTLLSQGMDNAELRITLQEGRFHQVKRMCHEIGCEVTYLKRVAMGGVMLDEALAPGEFRRLTEKELAVLQK